MPHDPEVEQLAEEILRGESERALGSCAADGRLTAEVSALLSKVLPARASQQVVAVAHADSWWVRSQTAVMALAKLAGADEKMLAGALLQAITIEAVMEHPYALHLDVAAWLVALYPEQISRILAPGDDEPEGARFLFAALFCLPGAVGANWLPTLARMGHGTSAAFCFQDMAAGSAPRWSDDDWRLRLDALAHSGGEKVRMLDFLWMKPGPPVDAARPLSRLVMLHATSDTDSLMQTSVDLFKGWRTDAPDHDVDLFSWTSTDPSELRWLRWLIELSGPPEQRRQVTRLARERGWITNEVYEIIGQEVDRPAWADGEVEWTIEPIDATGEIDLPEGRLAAGDPIWGFESEHAPVELPVRPGRYAVRVIRAHHPLMGRHNIAAEVVIDPQHPAESWVAAPGPGDGTYFVANGRGALGAPSHVTEASNGGIPYDCNFDDSIEVDVVPGEAGDMLAFAVTPQHHVAQSWVGIDARGNPVRLVTDLGMLDLDPTRRPLPW